MGLKARNTYSHGYGVTGSERKFRRDTTRSMHKVTVNNVIKSKVKIIRVVTAKRWVARLLFSQNNPAECVRIG